MSEINRAGEFCVAITVSDASGSIIYLNDKSASTFSKYGGRELEGRNLKDCHLAASREKINEIMNSGKSNCYTIEKGGTRKLIFQAPWYDQGQVGGLVELAIELPPVMEHFVRD
ncbi:MAG: PAS sensor protein [Bacteroidales bacterium]